MPATYWLASVVTTANVEASLLARDRVNRTGGQQICELLVYNTALTDTDRTTVES